jgi:cytosine deaminase
MRKSVRIKTRVPRLRSAPLNDLSQGRNLALLSSWEMQVLRDVERYGGFYNAHAHLCRAATLGDHNLRHIGTSPLEASNLPLTVKQNLVGDLHTGPAYTEQNLRERMSREIERQIALGVTRLDTNIDATPDLPEGGLLAIRVALELKQKYADRIKIRIAPTPIFGFKSDEKYKRTRWEVFAEAAEMCDYLSLLPEKDDYGHGDDPDGRVGFKHHIRMGVELACKLGKEVQFHLDQMNIPDERGTERMLELLEGMPLPVVQGSSGPTVWIIHMISVSAKLEPEFARIVRWLLALSAGVIICPSAALSMRQLRSIMAPTHNSIARAIDLIKSRVPIRIGTDNIDDTFVPQGNGDMLTEVTIGGAALRLNHPSIWAKLASGHPLNDVDRTRVGSILYEDRKACMAVAPNGWRPAVE